MFQFCKNLKTIIFNGFNTENVINYSYMFFHCESITSIDVSNFKTDNAENMLFMFSQCHKLTNLNLANECERYFWDVPILFFFEFN